MKLEKEVYIENTATTGELSSIIIRGYMETKEREILYKLRDKTAKLTLEVEEPILDEEERKYLSNVIRPFRDRVISIAKVESSKYERINIIYTNIQLTRKEIKLPLFEKGKMYKNLELNKGYSLKDLDL